ncbi:kelch-like protein 7 isoform X2 [Entelurus aequoreus]|uniref:kelch-like protein 7 isoform X2 n=1 Tax=Entelurus aequoreus TaxID=161455 RepID=UPI002B1D3B92|nr:kelch-like protein 7 isoform X2 [Entelurus aequoreus]
MASRSKTDDVEDGHFDSIMGTLCDVCLVVQSKQFPAHRIVLAAASKFFKLMFTTSMLESKSYEVELRSVDPEIIELLLEFIYTSQVPADISKVQSLLEVAKQYQIKCLTKVCVKVLKKQTAASRRSGVGMV